MFVSRNIIVGTLLIAGALLFFLLGTLYSGESENAELGSNSSLEGEPNLGSEEFVEPISDTVAVVTEGTKDCFSLAEVKELKANSVPLKVKGAHAKLQAVDAVRTALDVQNFARIAMAEMDSNQDGFISGEELDVRSLFTQPFIVEQLEGYYVDVDSGGHIMDNFDPDNTYMTLLDMENNIHNFFELSDFDGDGVLDQEESNFLKEKLYPEEVEVLELYDYLSNH